MNRSRQYPLLLLAAACLAAGPLAAAPRTPGADPPRAKESFVPKFTAITLSGETVSPASLKGKVVLLDFWATWCVPCVQAVPSMEALVKRLAGEPFIAIGLSIDNDSDKLRKFAAEKGMGWPQVWDPKWNLVGKTFGIYSFPTFLVLDDEGRIVSKTTGWEPGTTDREIDAAIEKALAGARKRHPRAP